MTSPRHARIVKSYFNAEFTVHQTLPPHIEAHDKVILFDGVCKLCNAWSAFIIRHDNDRVFKLCSVQSAQGQAVLAHFGYPTDHFDTMLYVEGGHCYQKSDAFLRIVNQIGRPWSLLKAFKLIPAGPRDWCYDRIARNRYRWFGRYDVCVLPDADHSFRYLDSLD